MFNKIKSRLSFRIAFFTLLLLFLPALSFARPVIFFTDILSGPNTGGENNNGCYLSIFGKGFGTTRGNSKVYINNVEVAAYKYWGPSIGRADIQQISVQPGPNVTSGPIKVVVDGMESNTDHTFTVRPGKIFFVALDGDDNTGVVGDITKPFRSPNKTFHRSDFLPGDFLVFRGGTWANISGNIIVMDKDADPTPIETPFTTYGYPGETVIFDMSSIDYGWGVCCIPLSDPNQTRNGYVIANFILSNSKDGVIDIGGNTGSAFSNNYVRLVNLDITGISGGNTGVVIIAHSYNSVMYGVKINAIAATSNKLHHHLYFSGTANNWDVGWIEIYSSNIPTYNGGWAFQMYTDAQGDFIGNVSIHDSIFHDLPRGAIVWTKSMYGNMLFYNNIVRDTGLGTLGGSGININEGAFNGVYNTDFYIYNNTFYHNTAGSIVMGWGWGAHNVTLQNNIIIAASSSEKYINQDSGWTLTGTLTADHNLYYGSTQPIPSWDDITTRITLDPKVVDLTNYDFHLLSDSPAIDAGVNTGISRDYDGNPRPKGKAYDIGAYEYSIPTPVLNPVP